ncbi:MAG TPA: ATP-binding protein [Polyangia bacterium]|nr:ATP-binding protein [Polyangia bacterium]
MSSNRLAELELEARREAALQAVTAALSAAVTREQILEAILDDGSRVLRCSAAVAYLLSRREDGEVLALVARRGIPDELARVLDGLPLTSNDPVARSIREGLPVWVSTQETLAHDFPEFERAVRGTFARQAVVALPLRVRGALVGALGLAFPETHAFDRGERAFMTTLAERCEAAMERARLYEESQQARAAAEASRAETEALLRSTEIVAGILAHDLKNPLAAVLMNARLLRDAEAERVRTIGRRILTSGERMARMIDQILEWTRMRSGSGWITLERTACDLGTITDQVVSEVRARKSDASLVVETRGDLAGRWDADRLAQLVSNLVGNAVDHATRPGVSVSVEGRSSEVQLVVGNAGRIDEELLPVIFEPFHGRALGAHPRARGRGLGLGLYITRQIALAHGGRVELEQGPGDRVTFIVTLPRGPE